jgi:hypothetical protein
MDHLPRRRDSASMVETQSNRERTVYSQLGSFKSQYKAWGIPWDSGRLLGLASVDQGSPGQGNDFVAIVASSKKKDGNVPYVHIQMEVRCAREGRYDNKYEAAWRIKGRTFLERKKVTMPSEKKKEGTRCR